MKARREAKPAKMEVEETTKKSNNLSKADYSINHRELGNSRLARQAQSLDKGLKKTIGSQKITNYNIIREFPGTSHLFMMGLRNEDRPSSAYKKYISLK